MALDIATERRVPATDDLETSVRDAWRTSNRVTVDLIERLPPALWDVAIPGSPRRTIRTIGAHLHNTRCRWIGTLGREHGVVPPAPVDPRRVRPRQLIAALARSSRGIEAVLELGLRTGGRVPPSKGYVWRNLALDVAHVLTYFVAHEAHHRGQMVMVARQSGHRLPSTTLARLWHWKADVPRGRSKRMPRAPTGSG